MTARSPSPAQPFAPVSVDAPVAVVTGGTRGVGRAIAHRLAVRGHRVAVVYSQDEGSAREVTRAISAAGGSCRAVRANLTDSGEIDRLFDELAADYGQVQVLVNNAGSGVMRPVRQLAVRHFERSLALNVRAVLHAAQRASSLMGDGGSIVTVTSIGSRRVLPGYTALGVAKAAAESLTGYLAVELAGSGVRVNAVCAGPIRTRALESFPNAARTLASALDQTPTGRLTTCEDVADTVEYLCGPLSRQVCGQTIVVDGGLSLTVHIS